jgi:hypothetical protein
MTEQVVIALDLCFLWAKEMQALLGEVAKQTSLRTDQITVTFSHTHAAGLYGSERHIFPGGELIAPYLAFLAKRVADVVRQARRGPPTAFISYGIGRCNLAFKCDGVADDTLIVARVTEEVTGNLLGTIVNYACRPASLGPHNYRISPDFAGAMRELVEQATDAPCIFLQGACGNLDPRENSSNDPEVADRNGRQLAEAALAVLGGMPGVASVVDDVLDRLTYWRRKTWTLPLAYRPDLPQWNDLATERDRLFAEEQAARNRGDDTRAVECRHEAELAVRSMSLLLGLPRGDHFPFPITLWQLGTAFWLAIDSLPFQDLQMKLRQRFPETPIMIMTLANGIRASYLPRAEDYGTEAGRGFAAVLAVGCLEELTEEIGRTIEEWRNSAP